MKLEKKSATTQGHNCLSHMDIKILTRAGPGPTNQSLAIESGQGPPGLHYSRLLKLEWMWCLKRRAAALWGLEPMALSIRSCSNLVTQQYVKIFRAHVITSLQSDQIPVGICTKVKFLTGTPSIQVKIKFMDSVELLPFLQVTWTSHLCTRTEAVLRQKKYTVVCQLHSQRLAP